MNLFKNFSIKNKIMFGIGMSFILSMLFLMGIVVYQFNDLSAENQNLIEEELLERKYDKYQTLVKNRAEILSKNYHLHLQEKEEQDQDLTESEIRKIISKLNSSLFIDDMYFFIYDLEGNTISLPPTPVLEGTNRKNFEIEDRSLLREMISIIEKSNGGRISYPYTNPRTDKVEIKYGYVQKIESTEMFVGAGGYQSSYYNIVEQLLTKIFYIRNKTIYLLLLTFIIIMIIIFLIIFDISRYINSNFEKLLSSFKKVEKGQLNFQLDINSGDEFGSLASEFNQMLSRIKKLTYNDPLTGLPNLNFLESQLAETLRKKQNKADNIYLFTLIADNLTLINSNYGYQKGNEILQELYQRLSKNLSEDTTIARKNGEFIFYFKSKKIKKEIKEYAEVILRNLSKPYEIQNKLIYLNLKLGIAVYEKQDNCSELIRKSRLALHFVDKKNNIKFFNDSMLKKLSGKLNLESKLRKAIINKDFKLHYQPQLECKTNKVVGAEALIRCKKFKEINISPEEFILIAEETGMILDLGEWILDTALKQLKIWHDKGYKNLFVSVNIAPQQFQQDQFVSKIKKLLDKHLIQAKYLELEITERTVIKDVDNTVKVLNELKKLGVLISIDDFGTGYSSLEYLNRFAIDKLKIDKSFVHSNSNLNIVKTIIVMGKNLGLEVVAEGVENQAELDFLIKNNCNNYQGYYFSKPKNASEIEKCFSKKNINK
jgi:diguanylate cyclase (GGDEF)-like protein